MKTIGVLCALACWTLAGCAQHERGLPREVVTAFQQTFNNEDLDACLALFTEDAQIIPDRGPIIAGRQEIREFLEAQIKPIISFDTRTLESVVRRDLAFEQGEFRVRDIRKGANIELGNYIHVWKKIGGDWKLYRVMYNTDMSRPAEVQVSIAPSS